MVLFKLDSPYLQNVVALKSDDAFEFICNDRKITSTKVFAIVFSTIIKNMYINDPLVNHILIKTPLSTESLEIFQAIIRNGFIETEIGSNTSYELFLLGKELDNYDLIMQFSEVLKTEPISSENILTIFNYELLMKKDFGTTDFIISNYYSIKEHELIEIFLNSDIEFCKYVFSSQLVVTSESQVANVIIELCKRSKDYYVLLSYINYAFLEIETINRIADFIRENIDPITNAFFMFFWPLIIKDFLNRIKKISKNFKKIYQHFVEICNSGDTNMMKVALKNKYNEVTDQKNNDMLLYAAQMNNFKLAQMIFENGGRIDWTNNKNQTVVHIFANRGNIQAVKYFLDLNIFNLNTADKNGLTLREIKTNFESI